MLSKDKIWLKLAAVAAAQLLTFSVPQAESAPLQGGVSLEEELPAVDPGLKPGLTFNARLTESEPSNFWVQLPDWIGGSWQISEETSTYRQNYRTGEESHDRFNFKAKSRFAYGKQKDRLDHCWHYLGTPYTSATDFASVTEYHHVQSKELAEITGNTVAFKTRVTVIRVSKSTRKVTETYQQESITKYTFVSFNELDMESSTKVFSASGQAVTMTKNIAHASRVGPFLEVDQEDGRNLKDLFRTYLLTNNLTNLLPD